MNWLAPAEWMTSDQAERVAQLTGLPHLRRLQEFFVERHGYDLLLVGGAPRDLWLGRSVQDFDFLVTCPPAKLSQLCLDLTSELGLGVVALDRDQGYFRLLYKGSEGVDLAALNRSSVWHDLRRRDLTFNAMALSLDGKLFDPFRGRDDLREKTVRAVDRDVMEEDPLRILRCFRFAAALNFRIDARTLQYASDLAPLLAQVAGERVLEELRRFVLLASPLQWEQLLESSVLEAMWGLGPNELNWEWLRCWWSARTGPPAEFAVVLAALLWKSGQGEEILQRLRVSRATTQMCRQAQAGFDSLEEATPQTSREVYRLLTLSGQALPEVVQWAALPCFPRPLSPDTVQRLQTAADGTGELRLTPLPIDGNDLTRHLGKPPGPWLSPTLAELQTAWACQEVQSGEDLLAYSEAIER